MDYVLKNARTWYFLASVGCFATIGYALYLQYYQYMEPCPLCYLQRVMVIALGVLLLLAGIQHPRKLGAKIYALLLSVFNGLGIALAWRHLWIQSLPPEEVPSCTTSMGYMLETMPFGDAIMKALQGSAECAKKDYFLGLPLSVWTLIFFIAMLIFSWLIVYLAKEKSYFK
jgi:protein dithiol:quinone oxidoreductase